MSSKLPAWLVAAADQRVTLIERQDLPVGGVILTPLKEPGPNATLEELAKWERSCDACGADCTDALFWTGRLMRSTSKDQQVIMTYGVCEAHHHG